MDYRNHVGGTINCNAQTEIVNGGEKIVVLGAGESGVGTAILAQQKGFKVFVSDKGEIKEEYKEVLLHNEIDWEEGSHTLSKIMDADEVVKSPGIPDTVQLIIDLKEKGVSVVSEIEFAARYTAAKLICITGSNGKTTTTLMTYHIMSNAGLNVAVAGNIGESFAKLVAENKHDYYVLELSSFQLDGMFSFKANIAMLLNITPDHLDRYDNDMQKYVESKLRILQNQTEEDVLIYNADDEVIVKELQKRKIKARMLPFSMEREISEGACIVNEQLNININNKQTTMSIHELAQQGKHNAYNSMASGIAGKVLEIRKEIIRDSLSDFQNVEHRLEFVAEVHGIEFINDSKATNVNSTWYALESMQKPTIWIAGGVDKGNDYNDLLPLVREKVKAIVCLGLDNGKIKNMFGNVVDIIVETAGAEEAVKVAHKLSEKGDAVLLSPACASFDLFENYEDRGRQFKAAVRSL